MFGHPRHYLDSDRPGSLRWQSGGTVENGLSVILIAHKMLFHNRPRAIVSLFGIAVAFFLSASQFGLLVGWCNTTSAIIRYANVDLWVMARRTSAFEYGAAIPYQRLYQVRSTPGVDWAESMITTWAVGQCPDGHQSSLVIVGVDESLVGSPWRMKEGTVSVLHEPLSIVVDDLYRGRLDVPRVRDELEITGKRVVVGGYCEGVRTFTTSPFVFCSLETALECCPMYRADDVTYVLVRCAENEHVGAVRQRLLQGIPSVDVLTTGEFAVRTTRYWMLETGAGITVVFVAILGLVVGTGVASQTLYAVTNDNLGNYAMLSALGFSRRQLSAVVLWQGLFLGGFGIVLGSVMFRYLAMLSANSPVPIEMNLPVYFGIVAALIGASLLATFISMRAVSRVNAIQVFRS